MYYIDIGSIHYYYTYLGIMSTPAKIIVPLIWV